MNSSVVIFSRNGCHLCEVAEKLVKDIQKDHEFELEIIYINGDADLEREYGEEVPVTLINGKRHDYFRVDRARFMEAVLHPHQ
jgi:glutaredoxin